MAHNLVRKGGIPALAYPTSDAVSVSSCSLIIRHSEPHVQATISLQFSVPIHGFDDDQLFTLLYDADNLVPGTNSLGPAAVSLPQARLDEISRQGNPKPRALSLTLKKPCPVRCPPSSGSIAPKHGFDSRFRQLVDLARATEVHILFDYNWLHRDYHAQFQRLINYPERLTGFRAGNSHTTLYRQADWTVFSPVEEAASEAPPSYTNASNKRSRQAAASSSPEPPSLKRVLLSPEPFFAPSPTEKATTVSTPSPKPPFSPVPHPPDFQEAIKNVVETLLPDALQALLPDMLPRLFAIPPSSPSLSQSSANSNTNPISPFRALINAHVAAHTEARLQKIHTETVDHVAYLRDAADVEFLEELDEHRLDVTLVKDDGIAELNRVLDNKLVEFRERVAEITESVEEHAEKVYMDTCEKLDRRVELERTCVMCKKEILDEDRERVAVQDTIQGRSRRAISLP